MKLKPSSKPFRYTLGDRGEAAACSYLKKQGYKILEKNYRCTIGEIDLIVQKDGRIIFVEIKTRSNDHFGRPEESVHAAKQKKLIRLAQWYLKTHPSFASQPAGFDVIAVSGSLDAGLSSVGRGAPEIRHIPQAFTLPADND
ncbi:MAG: YraN family protein [Candidatus Omnitrophica bacterium]|nr:YraN family protein [Candidatus Omnitrophota bacterium]